MRSLIAVIAGTAMIALAASQAMADNASCIYHGLTYSDGAMICVGPNYGQVCEKGIWSTFQRGVYKPAKDANNPQNASPDFNEACKNAASATLDK